MPRVTATNRNIDVLRVVIIAGLIGEVIFELYAHLVSPALFGPALEPANLVMALSTKLFGISIPYSIAFPIHFVIGSVGFGIFVYIAMRLVSRNPLISGGLSGVALWFIAQGMLAPFIGRSFMMDFGPYTQSSFIGHVGMSIIIAYAIVAQNRGHPES